MKYPFQTFLPLHLLWLLQLLSSTICRGAESDGGLDLDWNPFIDDQIEDTATANAALQPLAEHTTLKDWITPIVGYTEDGAERARSHILETTTRFTLFPDPQTRNGAFAYSTFVFQHPRTGRWKQAVMILSLTPGLRGEFIGEAHFPEGLSSAERYDAWQRLNSIAAWNREGILRQFGSLALHF